MKEIYISFLVLYSYHVLSVSIHPLESDQNGQQGWPAGQMNNTIFRTSNKYFCAAVNDSNLNLIMYGTNMWRFPMQDINLTLRYPTSNKEECSVGDDVLITGFKVVLNTNGEGSNGFIVGGGILQDTITLSFTSSNISLIEYRFWVYGINKDTGHMYGLNPFSTVHYMC